MANVEKVPSGEVGNVVQDFVNDGAEHIVVQKEADGSYSVSAR
ncbi:MAG TPA: hypothetical protein VF824_02685 [Thermoanaerobaculia bacterium]|jgi:hypothetical protein